MKEEDIIHPLAPRGYWVERYSKVIRLPVEPGAPLEIMTTRVLRVERSIVEWRQSTRNMGHGELKWERVLYGDGVLSLEPSLAVPLHVGERGGEALDLALRFGRKLHPGDRVEFSILERCRPAWDQHVRPEFRDRIGVLPFQAMRHVDIRVIFPLVEKPETLWYFTDVHDWELYVPPTTDRLLSLDANGQAFMEWEDPAIGLISGVGWQWGTTTA